MNLFEQSVNEGALDREGADLTPRILSKETTQEILGDNLSSIVAIGKDGHPVLFLPYGADLTPPRDQLTDQDSSVALDITIKIPKC